LDLSFLSFVLSLSLSLGRDLERDLDFSLFFLEETLSSFLGFEDESDLWE